MDTVSYRQDRPAARIAIVSVTVAVIAVVLFSAFGFNNAIDAVEASRHIVGGRRLVAMIVTLIFLPPAFILVRALTPKQDVVFGAGAFTIKAKREQRSIAYPEIGSMVLHELTARRLELYGQGGELLTCFRTGTDRAALSSLVRLMNERIAFHGRPEGRAIRYVRK